MRIDQLFYLSSEFPHWTLFSEGIPQTAVGRIMKAELPIVAGRLLDCADPDQLEWRLEELLDDPAASKSYQHLMEALQSSMDVDLLPGSAQPRPEVAEFLGISAFTLLASAWSDVVKQSEAYSAIAELLGDDQLQLLMARQPEDTLGACLVDEHPLELRMLMYKWITSSLCGFAIVAAMMQQKRIPDWLGMCLVERFIEGGRSFLRFAQSIPGLADPENPGPYDLERIQREHDEFQAWIRMSIQRHRASGLSITPLFANEP